MRSFQLLVYKILTDANLIKIFRYIDTRILAHTLNIVSEVDTGVAL